jgi:hypothetical protein
MYCKKYLNTDLNTRISNFTKISSLEWLCLVVVLVILAQQDEGWSTLDKSINDSDHNQSKRNVKGVYSCVLING